MDRKEFLVRAGQLGVACCGLSLIGESPLAAEQGPPLTPDKDRVAWVKVWTKRFFDLMDQELDAPTRQRLMEKNGAICFRGSLKGRTPTPVSVDEFVKRIADHNGPDSIRREGNVVHFAYVKNPAGLKVSDGYCLCPMVEDGPTDLSPTFCHCSVGYVREMFQAATGQTVKVDLVESLRRGGKSCRFRVELGSGGFSAGRDEQ